jgi:hypothetical protein
MSEQYEIRTVADFLKVPASRIEVCLRDFQDWLVLGRNAVELETMVAGVFLISPQLLKVSTERFAWVDDEIRGVSALRISDLNGETIADLDLINNPPFATEPDGED